VRPYEVCLWEWVKLARQATDGRVGKVVAIERSVPMRLHVEWNDGSTGVYLMSELEVW